MCWYGGRGVSSAISFLLEARLFLGQECLYMMPSILCLQDLGQREMAKGDSLILSSRIVQKGILFLLWFLINVFIRKTANGWLLSKGPTLIF